MISQAPASQETGDAERREPSFSLPPPVSHNTPPRPPRPPRPREEPRQSRETPSQIGEMTEAQAERVHEGFECEGNGVDVGC